MTQPPSNPPAGQETLRPIEELVAEDKSGWAQFIWNCTTGDNYFKHAEYCSLIRTLEDYATELAAAKAQLAEAQNYVERAFQQLEVYGVPRSRAKYVSNGIEVLVTRMDREIHDLRAQLAAAQQDMKEECAKVCAFDYYDSMECRKALLKRAAAIRALKP